MIVGLLLALLAGSLVSLQNIFNTKVNEDTGSWATTTLVLGMGFLASLLMGIIFEGKDAFSFHNMQPWYWFSGLIGVGVVICLVHQATGSNLRNLYRPDIAARICIVVGHGGLVRA